jgi:hypothetical protein
VARSYLSIIQCRGPCNGCFGPPSIPAAAERGGDGYRAKVIALPGGVSLSGRVTRVRRAPRPRSAEHQSEETRDAAPPPP